MQTQLMPEVTPPAETAPWLEPVAADGQADQRIVLDTLPFRIGRVEPAELKIASGRVSREHAVIETAEGGFEVRDLGSTNGTFVNGQRIDVGMLADGDLLAIADMEFTFLTGQASSQRDMATQAIGASRRTEATCWDVIRDVRWRQERLTCRAVESVLQPIVRLADRGVWGYEALPGGPTSMFFDEPASTSSALQGRLTLRWFQLQRLLAVEQAGQLADDVVVFVRIQPGEILGEELAGSFQQLRHLLTSPQRLVVELPDPGEADTANWQDFCQRLRQTGIGTAHDGSAAGAADYLRLAAALVRDVHRHCPQWEQMREVVETARAADTQVIATAVVCEEEAAACREAGCGFAQGSLFEDGPSVGASSSVRESRVETENLRY